MLLLRLTNSGIQSNVRPHLPRGGDYLVPGLYSGVMGFGFQHGAGLIGALVIRLVAGAR